MSGVALFAVLAAFGVVVGAAAGLLGVGGGVLMVPFLTLVAGMSQHEAEATSLLVVLPTAIVASIVLRRRQVGDLGVALRHARPEDEQRDHDDAAADAEQAGEDAAGDSDRDQLRIEPEQERVSPRGHGGRRCVRADLPGDGHDLSGFAST